MKKPGICLLLIILTFTFSCNEEKEDLSQNLDDVLVSPIVDANQFIAEELESSIEIVDVIQFNDRYIFAGYGGFLMTDQSLEVLDSYEQYMIPEKLFNYKNEFTCICTTEGIYKVDNSFVISKIIDLPCSDMEIDGNGEIIFLSGSGELSQERQIPANILVLNVEEQQFDFYTDPGDSIGAFLDQIEVLSNGDIFALAANATVYHYQDKKIVSEYSKETISFFPKDKSGLGTGYEILALENELYFITPQIPRRLLTYQQSWQTVFNINVTESFENHSAKDREILFNSINNIDKFNDKVLIGTQNGVVKVDPVTYEYDFIKDPNFPNQFVRNTYYSTISDEVIVVLAGNNIIKYLN